MKSHHIDEPLALGFSFNFIVGLGFGLKKGGAVKLDLETIWAEKWDLDAIPRRVDIRPRIPPCS